MDEFEIHYRATDTELVIFWDKPQSARKYEVYGVDLIPNKYAGKYGKDDPSFEDRRTAQKVERTHCTFTDLEPDSSYHVRVFIGDSPCSLLGELDCTTKRTLRRIDISAEPYNAVGDGVTVNTSAIQHAIDDCGPGDSVYIPAGKFLTGALNLHSDMELYIEKDGVLQGTADPADYLPRIWSRFEGYERECYRSLLNLGTLDHNNKAYSCENVVIRGKGSIFGGGFELAKAIAAEETERLRDYIASLGDKISEFESKDTLAFRARGRLINMSNCRFIWIHGLDLGYSPAWNLHFIYSAHVVTDHCRIYSEGVWNGDGWNPDSSEYSAIFACEFFTEDDCVAVKSGKNPEGNIIARPTRHIRIFDCVTHFGHGLCIGSEMSGGVEDVRIWDCEMGPTWSGIEIKSTAKRGGYVKNILVRDTVASHVTVHYVGFNDDGEGAKKPPVFEDFTFERMYLLGRYLDNNAGAFKWHICPAIEVIGFEQEGYEAGKIRFADITIENANKAAEVQSIYHAEWAGSVALRNCRNVSLENISTTRAVKEYFPKG